MVKMELGWPFQSKFLFNILFGGYGNLLAMFSSGIKNISRMTPYISVVHWLVVVSWNHALVKR